MLWTSPRAARRGARADVGSGRPRPRCHPAWVDEERSAAGGAAQCQRRRRARPPLDGWRQGLCVRFSQIFCTASGIDDLRFHDLRHTFASWLVQRGRTLKEVQEALGHQTITMTMRYSHLAPGHRRATVAALDGALRPESGGVAQGTTKAQEVEQRV